MYQQMHSELNKGLGDLLLRHFLTNILGADFKSIDFVSFTEVDTNSVSSPNKQMLMFVKEQFETLLNKGKVY
jgi:hypothetical protein